MFLMSKTFLLLPLLSTPVESMNQIFDLRFGEGLVTESAGYDVVHQYFLSGRVGYGLSPNILDRLGFLVDWGLLRWFNSTHPLVLNKKKKKKT